ncbi:hypothetical protein BCR42DRAFT_472776 [Absidia repens]|uniref:Uncharacterized protein n=1 Tax=Absidia repens TaxID=90262 RepID=A0A1X2I053_9FUNG|nr:hypothetical protein BCR42DRAFT_472776 [Absidia repens]
MRSIGPSHESVFMKRPIDKFSPSLNIGKDLVIRLPFYSAVQYVQYSTIYTLPHVSIGKERHWHTVYRMMMMMKRILETTTFGTRLDDSHPLPSHFAMMTARTTRISKSHPLFIISCVVLTIGTTGKRMMTIFLIGFGECIIIVAGNFAKNKWILFRPQFHLAVFDGLEKHPDSSDYLGEGFCIY